ncbi:MAG TPA: carboxypeptidase-like regulatory domain-containing protein [Candidatus Thermoplasmatota archaeon]|nr:carboxypeptidase-like regulatory domain-containing protein [Candidatus Thermoplasmatota archaeon]
MRGLASVLTIAFVFASSSLLLGQAAGQQTEPAYPDEYRQPATDAFIEGTVSGPKGPIEGVGVNANNYGSPEPQPMPAEEPASDSNASSGSGSSGSAGVRCCCCYYGGNSTVTDAAGHFRLGVMSGENQLSFYHGDFVPLSQTIKVAPGETAHSDVELKAYPERTAHLVGKVVDAKTGKAVPNLSIYVENPLYGRYACSAPEGSQSPPSDGEVAPDGQSKIAMPAYDASCPITTKGDGSYDGMLTPGYSIVHVSAYADCSSSSDADGSSSSTCGPEYLSFTRTVSLPANETTRLDVKLASRAGPDATVSGYLVDAETGQAIPGATISFSNEETWAYGSATTDSDGSYKLRLRSGHHSVNVWAPGHLPWASSVDVPKGTSDLDVLLTPGEAAGYGGCCYAYATMEGKSMAVGTADAAAPSAAGGGGSAAGANGLQSSDDSGSGDQYEDLGGGLGPYDASERSDATANDGGLEDSGKGAPGAGLLLALTALGAVLVLRRRSA